MWRHLEPSGGIWEASGRHLEMSGSIWEPSGRHLGGIWEASGASGWHLGGTWRHLEASGRHLGGKRGRGGPEEAVIEKVDRRLQPNAKVAFIFQFHEAFLRVGITSYQFYSE